MKEVFVRGTSPRTRCLRRTPTPFYCPGLCTGRPRAAALRFEPVQLQTVTTAGEISLRHAGNEGFERTEEEAYV